MKLIEFASANLRYEAQAIDTDAQLNQEMQAILINLGFSTRIEKPFGNIAMGALSRFQAEDGIRDQST